MKKIAILLLCILMPVTTVFAQTGKPLSVEVLWQLSRIGNPSISPNGDYIIAPVTEYDVPADKGNTQLWLFSKDGKQQRALTAKGGRGAL